MCIYQKSNLPPDYYVYAYLRQDGSPYYIGKGKLKRAWSTKHVVPVPSNQKLIIIVEAGLSEIGAFAIERRLISWYGRKDLGTGILRNKTGGGEGPSGGDRRGQLNPMFGKKHSMESNFKRSKKLQGIKKSKESINKRLMKMGDRLSGAGNPMFGKTHSDSTKQKQSESAKNRTILTCVHCGKTMTTNFTRWHGDNCKFKGAMPL